MDSLHGRSVVDYVSPGETRRGHRCGYCKSSDGRINNGMIAKRLTCQDYQDLIERGWRRSGTYVYKPRMKRTCCPPYAIRCEVDQFQLSKSQKKVLKRMTKYLLEDRGDGKDSQNHSAKFTKPSSASVQMVPSVAQQTSDSGTDCECKKETRMVKSQQKPKSLEDFIFSETPATHKLTVKLVASDVTNPEFAATFKEEHHVYKKYQMHVHHDTPRDCNHHQFQRFLVDSPLIVSKPTAISCGKWIN
jgi:arginine-tRNA-protein transferase